MSIETPQGPQLMKHLESTRSIQQRVEDLLAQMSLKEKLAQLGAVFSYDLLNENGFCEEKAASLLRDGIGQVTRLGTYSLLTPQQRAETANAIQALLKEKTRLGIPAVFHDECCAGFAALGGTRFPQMIGLASTFEPELAEAMTNEIRKQMRATGSHHGLAPVLDIYRDPRWGRVEETFGEDASLVAQFGSEYIRGLQGEKLSSGVMATAKHFLAHSAPEGGLNCAPVHLGPREVRETFLLPYETAILEADAAVIMNSYSELDGRVVAADGGILTDLLRGELGFTGPVASDYLSIPMLHDFHRLAESLSEAAAKAINAGIDLELPETFCFGGPLELALETGKVQLERIDEAVRRVLVKKFELGLFDKPYAVVDDVEAIYSDPRPRELALEIARKSLVLLKNEDGILPLSQNPGTLAIIGPNAASRRNLLGDYSHAAMIELMKNGAPEVRAFLEGGHSQAAYDQSMGEIVTVLEAVQEQVNEGTKVLYARGCDLQGEDRSGFEEAIAIAKKADSILLVLGDKSGLAPGCTTGEFHDRASLDLPGVQGELVRTVLGAAVGKPVAAVLINGRPLAISELVKNIPAILEAWIPGEQGGRAIAEALFGITNPGGKLPVTVARSAGQVPIFYNHKPSGGRSHIYGDYTDLSAQPLFSFGHGLSYTHFVYSKLEMDRDLGYGGAVQIVVTISNAGDRAGDEVAQLYIQDVYASVPRPVKELKGYKRLCLEAGQSARVAFKLSPEHLAYYDEGMELVVEPGIIRVMVGSSSDDIRLEGSFNVLEKIQVQRRSTKIEGWIAAVE